jgi:hypothetical protein
MSMNIINNTPTGGVWLKTDWSTKEIQHMEVRIPTAADKANAPVFEIGMDLRGVDMFGMSINMVDVRIAQMRGSTIASLNDGSLPTSQQRIVDMQRMMLAEVNKMSRAEAKLGLYGDVYTLERLAKAYDIVWNEITEGGANNRHVNFLDRGFTELVEHISANTMGGLSNAINFTAISHQSGNYTYESMGSQLGNNTYDDFRESGRRQGQIFADVFLRNHRNGADTAFSLATEALSNMPQTTSLRNISYSDFMILNSHISNANRFQWNSLNTSGLSVLLNSFISERQASFDEYYKNFLIDIKA